MAIPIRDEVHLDVPAPASPRRVEAIARLFSDALAAVDADLAPESITLVVENLDARAHLRARDARGSTVIRHVARVLDNPLEAVQAHPADRQLAAALARRTEGLVEDGGVFRFRVAGTEKRRRLDQDLARVLQAAGRPPVEGQAVSGTSEVYTRVLRAGKQSLGARFEARILIDGKPVNVRVTPGYEQAYVQAIGREPDFRVRLYGTWREGHKGTLQLDPKGLVAGKIEEWSPSSGQQLVEAFDGLEDKGQPSPAEFADILGINTEGDE